MWRWRCEIADLWPLSDIRRLDKALAHQNRTIAIASDSALTEPNRQKSRNMKGFWAQSIAARNRRSLATFHRTIKSQCIIAVSCLGNRAISVVCDGHRNRKSQKSLRFRCAKDKAERERERERERRRSVFCT